MGLKTRITSQGVVTTRESDGEATFSVEVDATAGVSVVSGSSTVAMSSTTLYQSGGHSAIVATLPTIAAVDVGKSITVMHESLAAQMTLSGTQSIVGNSWELVISASVVDSTKASVMAVSGTDGFRWIQQ